MNTSDLLITLPFKSNTDALTLAQLSQIVSAPATQEVVSTVLNLLGAIVILILGWIVALIVSSVVYGTLKRTKIDNRIAAWLTGQPDQDNAINVEKWVATIAFWVVMLFALVGFFNTLDLDVVSAPLKELLDEVATYIPRLVSALVLGGVAWLVATLVKTTLTRGMQNFSLDDRLAEQLGGEGGQSPLPLNETLGNILYWLIFLLFLPIILDTLQLQGPLEPVQNLVDELLSALPQIFTAVLVGVIGWGIAQFVRKIVVNFLKSIGADQVGTTFGLSQTEGEGIQLSNLAGTIVYALILIFTGISALEELQIDAISEPAIAMLNQVLTAIPYVLQAGLILLVAYIIARFVTDLVTSVLTGLGFNAVLSWIGLQGATLVTTGEETTTSESASGTKTPSEIAGILVGVAIVLFGAVAAVDALQFEELSGIVTDLVEVGGRILYGLVVLAIGLYLANLAFRLVSMPGTRQSKLLAQAARLAIIILVTAMGIEQMGIATNIINLAFGLLTGAIAVAIAIAFGWGGKDLAGEQLKKWIDSLME